jgi:hypothetical protein
MDGDARGSPPATAAPRGYRGVPSELGRGVVNVRVIDPVKAATLFWRLAVLRRQVERAGVELALLSELSEDEDLAAQLSEACQALDIVLGYLKPMPGHEDCVVTKEA